MDDPATAARYFQRAATAPSPSVDAREELWALLSSHSAGDTGEEEKRWLDEFRDHASSLGVEAFAPDPGNAGTTDIWIQFGRTWQRVPTEAKRGAGNIWIQFGHILMDRGNAAEAAKAYRKALELDPDDVYALLSLGRAQLSLNNAGAAEIHFRRAAALSPPNAEAAQALSDLKSNAARVLAFGNDAREKGRWQDAIGAYREFLNFRPTAANVWLQLGFCLAESGDFAEAQRAHLTSWELDPKHPRPLRSKSSPAAVKTLTAIDYDEQYYTEHAEAGLDYLNHGFWHESYAALVTESTLQSTYSDPFVIDAGCACGSILKGFKNLPVYKRVLGVDLSKHMIEIGRKHFGYSEDELIAGSIANLPVEPGTVSLLHSAQVLEHIGDELIDPILDEIARVLRPGGRAFLCLDAMRDGEDKAIYMGDPTHVNIQPVLYWTGKLQKRGLLFDIEAYNRFAHSPRGPTDGDPRSFFETYPYWSTWTLVRA